MPSPVKPSQFAALVPTADDPFWKILTNFFYSGFLWYQFRSYAFSETGAPTDTWIEDMCTAICKVRSTTAVPLTYSDCGCHDVDGRVV
jgi:hypothetical protein